MKIRDIRNNKAYNNNGGNNTNDFRNPKSLLRNTIRVRGGEYCELALLDDAYNSDLSYYHIKPGMSKTGKVFSEFIYCPLVNTDGEGERILEGDCLYCQSEDEKERRKSTRIKLYAYCYNLYHIEDSKYDNDDWEEIQVGRRTFYKEVVDKPQLLSISNTTFKLIEAKEERLESIRGLPFEFLAIKAEDSKRVQYSLEASYGLEPLSEDNINGMLALLPPIEELAAGKHDDEEWFF